MMDDAAAGAWQALDGELAAWADSGRQVEIWWRDDDATAPCPALERLLDLAAAGSVPLALAVIPQRVDPLLATVLSHHRARVAVLQHGFAHADHAPAGAKKCELVDPARRPAILEELNAGRTRLARLLGDRLLPVMVPPWNRIDAALTAGLPSLGFAGLSSYRARPSAMPVAGLWQVNCHVDILQWRPRRQFLGTEAALALLIGHLTAKRKGMADAAEPSGLLTHHQVHEEAAWTFLAQLFDRLGRHPTVRLLPASAVFAGATVGKHRP